MYRFTTRRIISFMPWMLLIICASVYVYYHLYIPCIKTSEGLERSILPDQVWFEKTIKEADAQDVPEEMFKLGFLLFLKGYFKEADQILRYIVNHEDNEEWFTWRFAARDVLLRDEFHLYYLNHPGVSNTSFFGNIPDEKLFDQESVRRIYGKPERIVTNSDGRETWYYTNTGWDMEMSFTGRKLNSYLGREDRNGVSRVFGSRGTFHSIPIQDSVTVHQDSVGTNTAENIQK